jgi:hypothetical protein
MMKLVKKKRKMRMKINMMKVMKGKKAKKLIIVNKKLNKTIISYKSNKKIQTNK